MENRIIPAIFALSLTGCAGLDISSLSTEEASNAHVSGKEIKGYIVYQPMIVVEVGEREICIKHGNDGKCADTKLVCGIGEPKTMPDYSKPYRINSRSGLGKAGVDIKIEDGWRLGGIKDESDNTALLNVLATAAGIKPADKGSIDGSESVCQKPGLYRLIIEHQQMKLIPIFEYLESKSGAVDR